MATHVHMSRDVEHIADDCDSLTLTRMIMTQTQDADLALLLQSIQTACKVITRAIRKAGIADLYGLAGHENSTGDDVKKLDMISNDIMVNMLRNSCVCGILVSEELENPIVIDDPCHARFAVAFDPLDGSSNIDCNVSTGTIFSVWNISDASLLTTNPIECILRPGNEVICAGYCMYGSATDMVLTYGHGVHKYTLDPSIGEFIHTQANLRIPEKPKQIYSVNEGNYSTWDENIQRAVDSFKFNSPKPYSARYVGSMVADVHRTLLYGGIFMYPADKKTGKGKLRVLYEGFPMSLIVEQAGGCASTGMFHGKVQRILDLTPEQIHDKCPVILGCERDVQRVLSYYATDAQEVL